jgi:hypothetical protein
MVPVDHFAGVFELGAEGVQASVVTEDMANGQSVFAVRAELWPMLVDEVVVSDQTAVGEDVQAGSCDPLGGRERHGHRV